MLKARLVGKESSTSQRRSGIVRVGVGGNGPNRTTSRQRSRCHERIKGTRGRDGSISITLKRCLMRRVSRPQFMTGAAISGSAPLRSGIEVICEGTQAPSGALVVRSPHHQRCVMTKSCRSTAEMFMQEVEMFLNDKWQERSRLTT